VKSGRRTDLVLSVIGELQGFDPKSGKQIWRSDGLSPLVYASQVAGEGIIVGMGGFMGSTVAVKSGGTGDISKERLWHVQRERKNRLSTGVIHGGHVYVANSDGVTQCIELATGTEKWNERLRGSGAKGEIWGSAILVGDNIYVTNQSGDTFVFKANPEKLEIVSANPLGEMSNATPALSNGDIFIRTHQALWCIGERER
jgi:outer membrane protein assembly factor BamB